jgi:hypothetical protein
MEKANISLCQHRVEKKASSEVSRCSLHTTSDLLGPWSCIVKSDQDKRVETTIYVILLLM